MKYRNHPIANGHLNFPSRNGNMNYRRQVFIEFREPATALTPLADRKYMMTHSDDTGDLFVVIGTEYAEDKVGELRDEVRLEWTVIKDTPILYGEVLIDGDGISPANAQLRDTIFKREMPLALQAIYHADQQFFATYPELQDTPVFVQFSSTQHVYNRLYSFGTIGEYDTLDPRSNSYR